LDWRPADHCSTNPAEGLLAANKPLRKGPIYQVCSGVGVGVETGVVGGQRMVTEGMIIGVGTGSEMLLVEFFVMTVSNVVGWFGGHGVIQQCSQAQFVTQRKYLHLCQHHGKNRGERSQGLLITILVLDTSTVAKLTCRAYVDRR
jgi:hypothetical protein